MLPDRVVQAAAKSVLQQLVTRITPASTEASIARTAGQMLTDSGRDYRPSDEACGEHNLITVDLSPRAGNVWSSAGGMQSSTGCTR